MEELRNVLKKNNGNPSQLEIYEALAKDAAKDLDVELVSVWLFDDKKSKITCAYNFDNTGVRNLKGAELFQKDYPHYFKAIVENINIIAVDVHDHFHTKELSEDYFKPNNIKSLLDHIIYKNMEPMGVICCETLSEQRKWSEDDVKLLRGLTVVAGLEIE